MKIIRTYLYITSNKKILFVRSILAYCGYSLISRSFMLLSKHKHCDNVQLIRAARKLEAEWWQICREAWLWGQRKMSQVLGTFGLLDFTMLWPILMCVLKIKNCLFLEFSKFFSGCGKPWINKTRDTESMDTGVCLYLVFRKVHFMLA